MTLSPAKIAEWKALAEAAYVSDNEAMQHDGECEHGMWWRDCPNSPCAEREWEQRHALAQAVPALLADNEALRSLLREVEWVTDDGPRGEACPICGGLIPAAAWEALHGETLSESLRIDGPEHGHRPDCRLAALLGGKP